jgi:adenosylcobinamide-GDP ribazoletransferase
MPVFEWKEDDMAHSLIFFPLVGAVIGGLVFAINRISPLTELPVAVRIILTMVIPFIITGGFHVDGFMDTEDAINSYAPREKKLEILKDAHIGAFAVISLVKWLLICAAAVTAILLSPKCDWKTIAVMGLTFVASRCLSGLTSLLFGKAKKTGMLYEETRNDQKVTVACLVIELVVTCLFMLWLDLLSGTAVLLTFALCTAYYRHLTTKEFGGVTGDTAGFFLTTGEIIAAVGLAASLYIRG